MTWLSFYREWVSELTSLCPDGDRFRSYINGSEFIEISHKDATRHGDELEEQLWAFREGLASLDVQIIV